MTYHYYACLLKKKNLDCVRVLIFTASRLQITFL